MPRRGPFTRPANHPGCAATATFPARAAPATARPRLAKLGLPSPGQLLDVLVSVVRRGVAFGSPWVADPINAVLP